MIHFISDLHLSDEQPHLIELFTDYLKKHTNKISKLYMLGDLFEVWIGDDYQPKWIQDILEQLAALNQRGVELYFLHGNRDFMVGKGFMQATGCRLLDDYATVQLGDHKVLLCHGDTLCIDDTAYQTFRKQVRTNQWQSQFLSLPIEQRLAIVADYRKQSKSATAEKQQDIMDVNTHEFIKVMNSFELKHMIHGHTHRPKLHQDQGLFRWVLSDWRELGQFVSFADNTLTAHYFDTSGIKSSEQHSMTLS